MLRNLLLVTIRNIRRQKIFSILNILGLSVGLMACLFIAVYSYTELSYDHFHEKAERIYRINQTFIWGESDNLFGSTGPAVMHAIKSEVPEFETMTRVHPMTPSLIASDDNPTNVFEEQKILAVDDSFLKIFTFPLQSGNPSTALIKPNSLIVTASMAEKYFGHTEVIGKQLKIGERERAKSYMITGVAHDVPPNSHIDFDFLISMSSLPRVADQADSWMWTTFVTFGLLREHANPQEVAAKVAAVPGKYLETFLQKYRGTSYTEFIESGQKWDLFIQPLLDIHLRSSDVYSRLNQVGNIQTVYILLLVALLILLISVINFINLSTARSATRAKEVGIRKVIGSGRKLLIYQFMTESIIYCLTALLFAFILYELLAPHLYFIMGKDTYMHLLDMPVIILTFVTVTIIIGGLGGLYPAFYLASFSPAQALKTKLGGSGKGGTIRNILVTAQFTLSIGLITCTLIVNDQVKYWRDMDVGFDRHNKLVIEHVERLGTSFEVLKNQLLKEPAIAEVTFASDGPPYIHDFDNFELKGSENKQLSVNYAMTDQHFISVYGLELTHGRNFDPSYNDSLNVIVSKSLVKAFGFSSPEDALHKSLHYYELDFEIIGIIEDVNANLSEKVYPTALFYKSNPIYNDPAKEYTLSLNQEASASEIAALLKRIERHWNKLNPDAPFSYTFLDDVYMSSFEKTMQFQRMLSSLAVLAVFIACLGLIGLVAFIIEKRNKEIGIRKVLGASTIHILLLLSGNFGKLLLIGFIISAPLTWQIMQQWLTNFDLRTSISLYTFFFAGAIMLLVAALTMSFQTVRASRVNPVDYLKEE